MLQYSLYNLYSEKSLKLFNIKIEFKILNIIIY
jgi:hypothetical protein